jgi:putative addiction module killer protein
MQPILKKKDIDKLSVSLNITPDKFKAKYVNKDGNGKSIINQLPCPFLKDNKCTQYDSRPVDCASYPHLHKKDFVFRLIGVVNNYEICPIVFNVYEAGNPGDVKPVGEGVSELRINYGPGYRVYYKKQGQKVVILLAGGDKSTQTRDIKAALRLSRNL